MESNGFARCKVDLLGGTQCALKEGLSCKRDLNAGRTAFKQREA